MPDRIVVSRSEAPIARLTLSVAESQNRLDAAMVRGIVQHLDQLRRDRELRALILAGAPDVFCAGASLDSLKALATGEADERDLFALPEALLAFPVPIVAALQGHAVGGGLALALYCDLVVAAEGARYGFNFSQIGITPGMGMTRLLPLLVGDMLAGEMLLTGRHFQGRELRGRGLFNYVVPAEEVDDRAQDLARQFALQPRHVLELLKETLTAGRREALAAAIESELRMHRICFKHPDLQSRLEQWYLS
jgi:4-carboxy-3-alkylbut-2-enoyl-[acp] decarboxylase